MLSQRRAVATVDPQTLVLRRVVVAGEHVGPGHDDGSDLVDVRHSRTKVPGVIEEHRLICCPGTRRPIEPARRSPRGGLMLLTQVASVSP